MAEYDHGMNSPHLTVNPPMRDHLIALSVIINKVTIRFMYAYLCEIPLD
jgi:hypothetical protein